MNEADRRWIEGLLSRHLLSNSELDADLQPSNVIEAIYALSNALHAVADAIKTLKPQESDSEF